MSSMSVVEVEEVVIDGLLQGSPWVIDFLELVGVKLGVLYILEDDVILSLYEIINTIVSN